MQMQDTFEGIRRFLPRPLAGEGWGEGVCDRACVVCFSLTLALSLWEREFLERQGGDLRYCLCRLAGWRKSRTMRGIATKKP